MLGWWKERQRRKEQRAEDEKKAALRQQINKALASTSDEGALRFLAETVPGAVGELETGTLLRLWKLENVKHAEYGEEWESEGVNDTSSYNGIGSALSEGTTISRGRDVIESWSFDFAPIRRAAEEELNRRGASAVPELITFLEQVLRSRKYFCFDVVDWLGHLGSVAQPAVPALLALLVTPIASEAAVAVLLIDPHNERAQDALLKAAKEEARKGDRNDDPYDDEGIDTEDEIPLPVRPPVQSASVHLAKVARQWPKALKVLVALLNEAKSRWAKLAAIAALESLKCDAEPVLPALDAVASKVVRGKAREVQEAARIAANRIRSEIEMAAHYARLKSASSPRPD